MFKKVILISMVLFLASSSVIATSNQKIIEQAKMILDKQLNINNFQVDIDLEIKAFSKQKSNFNFTYYYHQPDFVHLKTRDFVLLPTEPMKSLQPDFFQLENYNYRYLGSKEKLHLLELIPKRTEKDFKIILWLRLKPAKIEKAEIFFSKEKYPESFSIQADYQLVEGYSLPVKVEGKMPVPTKFGIKGKVLEYQEGQFTMELTNYLINQGLPEPIMKKYRKEKKGK